MIQLEKPGLLVHATKLEPRAWITLESLDWRSLADHLIFGVYGMYVSQKFSKGFLGTTQSYGKLICWRCNAINALPQKPSHTATKLLQRFS